LSKMAQVGKKLMAKDMKEFAKDERLESDFTTIEGAFGRKGV